MRLIFAAFIVLAGSIVLSGCSNRQMTDYEQGYMQGYVNSLAIQQIYNTQDHGSGSSFEWNRPHPGFEPLPPVRTYSVPQPSYQGIQIDSYKAPGYQVPPYQAPTITRPFLQQRRKPCSINNPC